MGRERHQNMVGHPSRQGWTPPKIDPRLPRKRPPSNLLYHGPCSSRSVINQSRSWYGVCQHAHLYERGDDHFPGGSVATRTIATIARRPWRGTSAPVYGCAPCRNLGHTRVFPFFSVEDQSKIKACKCSYVFTNAKKPPVDNYQGFHLWSSGGLCRTPGVA